MKRNIYAALVLCASLLSSALLLTPATSGALPMTGPMSLMIAATPTPKPSATPAPGPTPERPRPPGAPEVVPEARPSVFNLKTDTFGERKANEVTMPAQGGYARIPGVLTFRGGPYRQNAAYGYATAPQGTLAIKWEKKIGALDSWSGVGWNGQPALVEWPDAVRQIMNLHPEKKNKAGLVEVIYGALDGKIYFLDLEDGTPTRDAIDIKFPIKGSVSVDPRGIPLLFSGQGISRLNNRSGKIGLHIFSLLNGQELLLINGIDKNAYRQHGAFDSVALLDGASDTLIAPGENGLIYTYRLGTNFDPENGTLSIDPVKGGYRYRNAKGLGIENSIAVYGYYGFFTDNGGLLQCVNLNTLDPVWAADVKDDSDASCALDPQPDGTVYLYTATEVDKQGKGGKAYIRCFNAMTGEKIWEYAEVCTYDPNLNGGVLGSPLVGEHSVSDLVYFHVAKTVSGGGSLIAFDKGTGRIVWRNDFARFGWSSPVGVYGADGEAHVILGDSGGNLRLMDARTGNILSTLELEGNIEGSPAVFGDTLVVGTRGRWIYGITIR